MARDFEKELRDAVGTKGFDGALEAFRNACFLQGLAHAVQTIAAQRDAVGSVPVQNMPESIVEDMRVTHRKFSDAVSLLEKHYRAIASKAAEEMQQRSGSTDEPVDDGNDGGAENDDGAPQDDAPSIMENLPAVPEDIDPSQLADVLRSSGR